MNKAAGLLILIILLVGSLSAAEPEFPVTELNYPAGLAVIQRADWGWKALTDTIPRQAVSRITIHHGGVFFATDKDPVEYIRNLQDWSRAEKPWIDIPYHFMIDFDGNIYETRPINYPGDTNTDYDCRGHALICLIGNFEEQPVTPPQYSALVNLTAFLARTYSVMPENIKGHKDYTETLCPGTDLYRHFASGEFITEVQRALNPPTTETPE